MASIIVQLNTIKNDPDGQDVLDAIASGAEVINDDEFDISESLISYETPQIDMALIFVWRFTML